MQNIANWVFSSQARFCGIINTIMTATYEQSGLQFLYPENWTLDNREDSSQPWEVSVHSPTGSFWSLTVYDGFHDLDKLGEKMLTVLKQDYSDILFEYQMAEHEIGGHTSHGYDVDFFYLDFLVSAKLRTFQLEQCACLVLYQAEIRDFDELERVFEAITHSLLSPDH